MRKRERHKNRASSGIGSYTDSSDVLGKKDEVHDYFFTEIENIRNGNKAYTKTDYSVTSPTWSTSPKLNKIYCQVKLGMNPGKLDIPGGCKVNWFDPAENDLVLRYKNLAYDVEYGRSNLILLFKWKCTNESDELVPLEMDGSLFKVHAIPLYPRNYNFSRKILRRWREAFAEWTSDECTIHTPKLPFRLDLDLNSTTIEALGINTALSSFFCDNNYTDIVERWARWRKNKNNRDYIFQMFMECLSGNITKRNTVDMWNIGTMTLFNLRIV